MTNTRLKAWLTRSGGLAVELATARGGLSMRQLADKLGGGWNSSKVSKIENGDQLISGDDLEAWAAALQVSEANRRRWRLLLAEAQAKRAMFRRHRAPAVATAEQLTDVLEAGAAHIRAVSPYALPPLLQTKEYAEALRIGSSADDVSRAWQWVHSRQGRLTDPLRTFDFVIPESSLRMVPAKASVMAGQLDRLISAGAMGNVNIRILPMLVPLPAFPMPAMVTIYDDEAVVDDGIREHHYTGSDAEVIADWLDVLWESALADDAARGRILAAVDALRDI